MRFKLIVTIAVACALAAGCSSPKPSQAPAQTSPQQPAQVQPTAQVQQQETQVRTAGLEIVAMNDAIQIKGYGPKTRLAFEIMKDMTLKTLFSMPMKDVFAAWLANCDTLPSDMDPQLVKRAKGKLKDLVPVLQDPACAVGAMSFRALHSDVQPIGDTLTDKLKDLDKDLDLPFVHLQKAFHHVTSPTDVQETLKAVLDDTDPDPTRFGNMTLKKLYHTGADPEIYSVADIRIVIKLFQEQKILRNANLDLAIKMDDGLDTVGILAMAMADVDTIQMAANEDANQNAVILLAAANNQCCTRTTRTCGTQCPNGTCTMCGQYCCLASTWCPQ